MKVNLDRGSQNLKDKIQFIGPETIKDLELKKLHFVDRCNSYNEPRKNSAVSRNA